LPLHKVGTLAEEWTWEYRTSPRGAYRPLLSAEVFETLAVRIYVTAAAPVNAAPRWSYYHLACANAGARDQRAAEAAVWDHFMRAAEGPWPTNGRGQKLTFWVTAVPATATMAYTQRDAQDLILLGDSSCFGWADLLAEALQIHGIKAEPRGVMPQAEIKELGLPRIRWKDRHGRLRVDINGTGFIVRGACWRAPTLGPIPARLAGEFLRPGPFRWKFNDTTQPLCVAWPAPDVQTTHQGGYLTRQSNAVGMFGNHALVVVRSGGSTRWYDPSLGFGPHDNLLSYQHDLLGFGREDCGGIFAIVGFRPTAATPDSVGPGTLLLGARPAPAFLCIGDHPVSRKPA